VGVVKGVVEEDKAANVALKKLIHVV